MIEPAPVVSDSVAGKKTAGKATATVKKAAKKTAGKAAATATATEKWPFEWLPFGMQE